MASLRFAAIRCWGQAAIRVRSILELSTWRPIWLHPSIVGCCQRSHEYRWQSTPQFQWLPGSQSATRPGHGLNSVTPSVLSLVSSLPPSLPIPRSRSRSRFRSRSRSLSLSLSRSLALSFSLSLSYSQPHANTKHLGYLWKVRKRKT